MRTPEFYYRNSLAAALRGDISEAQELKELGDVRRESFGLSFSEGASEEYPFIEEALETLLNSYEFTRCQRPDGSFYGTRGKCRKGAEAGKVEKAEAKPKKTKRKLKLERLIRKEAMNNPSSKAFLKEIVSLAKDYGVDLKSLTKEDWSSAISRVARSGGYGGAIKREAEDMVALAASGLRNEKAREEMEP